MSSNNNSKKPKPLSASSLCKTASKYATRAQTADKTASSRQTRNPDPYTLPDQNIMNQINNVLSEDYIMTFNCCNVLDRFNIILIRLPNLSKVLSKHFLLQM